ncbi:hypothetical protein KCU77_g5252, partial [Aureobasidium melanogenum]
MPSRSDETNIPDLHAQILANLRITDPEIVRPAITTGTNGENWWAMIWNNEGEVIDCEGGYETTVAALRGLLEYTSHKIFKKWLKRVS